MNTDQQTKIITSAPQIIEESTNNLKQLIEASSMSDDDYARIMGALSETLELTEALTQTMRGERDSAIKDRIQLEHALERWYSTADDRVRAVVEAAREDAIDEIQVNGGDIYLEVFLDNLAENIRANLEYDDSSSLPRDLAVALLDYADLQNNEVAQDTLRELLAKVSGEYRDD